MAKIRALLMMSVLLIGAFFQTGEAEEEVVLSPCAKKCMPVCLRANGGNVKGCVTPCTDYCDQIEGAGSDSGSGGGGIMDKH